MHKKEGKGEIPSFPYQKFRRKIQNFTENLIFMLKILKYGKYIKKLKTGDKDGKKRTSEKEQGELKG